MKTLVVCGSRADWGAANAIYELLPEPKKITNPNDLDIHPFIWLGGIKSYCPDLAIVVGDRFEVLRATVELYIAGCCIAHVSGGDITEGSADDSMRHAISKLSHIHFPSNQNSARRLVQLGEQPNRIHVVGCPSTPAKMLTQPSNDFLLVVWHPNTLAGATENMREVEALTSALDEINIKKTVIGPNADEGNELIRQHMLSWTGRSKNTYVDTLSRPAYLDLLQNCAALIGNSSSGLYEAPSYGTPVVNIGDRQLGRITPKNVVNCTNVSVPDIISSIQFALKRGRVATSNPYGDGAAAQRIADIISKIDDPKKLLRKKWHDLPVQSSNRRNGTMGKQKLWSSPSEIPASDPVAGNGEAKRTTYTGL